MVGHCVMATSPVWLPLPPLEKGTFFHSTTWRVAFLTTSSQNPCTVRSLLVPFLRIEQSNLMKLTTELGKTRTKQGITNVRRFTKAESRMHQDYISALKSCRQKICPHYNDSKMALALISASFKSYRAMFPIIHLQFQHKWN